MIAAYDEKDKCWWAAGKGYLRPIAVEAETRAEAIEEYCRAFESHQEQE